MPKTNMEDVRRIQDALAVVVEELLTLRPRLRRLEEEARETGSYQLSQQHADGEDPGETIGFYLHGAIVEAIDTLDVLARELFEAKGLQWEEADYSLSTRENRDTA